MKIIKENDFLLHRRNAKKYGLGMGISDIGSVYFSF